MPRITLSDKDRDRKAADNNPAFHLQMQVVLTFKLWLPIYIAAESMVEPIPTTEFKRLFCLL